MSLLRTVACLLIGVIFIEDVAWAATATRNAVSAINTGTTIAAKSTQSVVSEQCEQQFFGCMDTFCLMDNANGGRCTCSDDGEKYDAQFAELTAQINKLDRDTKSAVNAIETGDAVARTAAAPTQQKKSQ